jgi:ATP-dependent DNA helicase PIF1
MNTAQLQAYQTAIRGSSVFITGPAGTGKSFLMNQIINYFENRHKKISVTSLTGVSASLLEKGQTFHSWLGMKYIPNMDNMEYTQLRDTILRTLSPVSRRRIRETQILIIDEISMMSYEMLTLLNDIARSVRKTIGLIGGIQVIALGDFHQLPPVKYKSPEQKYVFQNPIWNALFPRDRIIVLSEVVRQRDDTAFQTILGEIRNGRLRLENERLLCQKIKPLAQIPDTIPRLYAVKKDIEEMNARRLEQLDGDSRTISALLKPHKRKDDTNDDVEIPVEHKFPRDTLIVEQLKIKVGALVMFNKNVYADAERTMFIPNGKCGIVVSLSDPYTGHPIVEYEDEKGRIREYICKPESWNYPHYTIVQVPIMLAWNISIHKSQGSTLDKVAIDIGDSIFEYGQMYVALSRCRSLDGLTLIKFQPRKLKTDPMVKEYYRKLLSDEEDDPVDESIATIPSIPSTRKRSPRSKVDFRDDGDDTGSNDNSGVKDEQKGNENKKSYHQFFQQFARTSAPDVKNATSRR